MNKHIEVVKKWLDDPDSVTAKELRVNAAEAAYAENAANAAYDAANTAYDAADVANAKYYVNRYEQLTGE